MKPHPLFQLPALAAGFLCLTGAAFAQLPEGLDTTGLAPRVPEPAAAAEPAAAPAPEAVEIVPSRLAGDEITGYVRLLSSRFGIRNRATDPFGRNQDPDYVPPVQQVVAKSPRATFQAEPAMPFANIVAGIAVNTVIPAKQQFLIGNREFKANDVLSLRLPNGRQIKARVVAVTSARIRFAHAETGEIADLPLNLMPAGMSKGTGKISAPGVEPAGEDAPLDIQPSTPLSSHP